MPAWESVRCSGREAVRLGGVGKEALRLRLGRHREGRREVRQRVRVRSVGREEEGLAFAV